MWNGNLKRIDDRACCHVQADEHHVIAVVRCAASDLHLGVYSENRMRSCCLILGVYGCMGPSRHRPICGRRPAWSRTVRTPIRARELSASFQQAACMQREIFTRCQRVHCPDRSAALPTACAKLGREAQELTITNCAVRRIFFPAVGQSAS